MKAVITVTGKDSVGIIAKISTACSVHNVNIQEISQSVIGEYFAMIMLADISKLDLPFGDFVDKMDTLGKESNLDIHAMHEDIFNTMHHI